MPREVTANSKIGVPFVEGDLDDLRGGQIPQLRSETAETSGSRVFKWVGFSTYQLSERIRQIMWARDTNLARNLDLARNLLQQEELVHLLEAHGREQFPPVDPFGVHQTIVSDPTELPDPGHIFVPIRKVEKAADRTAESRAPYRVLG